MVVVASSSTLRHCVVSEASEDKGEGKGKGASSRRPHRVVMLVVLVEATGDGGSDGIRVPFAFAW